MKITLIEGKNPRQDEDPDDGWLASVDGDPASLKFGKTAGVALGFLSNYIMWKPHGGPKQ